MSPETRTHASAWIGEVGARTYASALLEKEDLTTRTNASAQLVRNTRTHASAYITEARGTFRGVMSIVDRDALTLKQPEDTIICLDAAPDSKPEEQMWTGTQWIGGHSISSRIKGISKPITIPMTSGWRIELGKTFPARYWDGTTTRFSLDSAGNVVLTGSLSAATIDIPSSGALGMHVDTSGNVSVQATTTSKASDGTALRGLYINVGVLDMVDRSLRIWKNMTESQPRLAISAAAGILLWSDGASAFGSLQFDASISALKTEALLVSGGLFLSNDDYIELTEKASDPSTPAANKLRLYSKDSGGISRLFYKDDGGTVRGPL